MGNETTEGQVIPQERGAHTPGPWMAEGWDETEEGCAVIAVHEELGLRSPTRGMVAWVTTIAGASFESPGKAYANACLIAAAPDLLAALQEWMSAHREVAECGHDEQRAADEREQIAREMAAVAIAKATGAQP